jgi:hypothetical protein
MELLARDATVTIKPIVWYVGFMRRLQSTGLG